MDIVALMNGILVHFRTDNRPPWGAQTPAGGRTGGGYCNDCNSSGGAGDPMRDEGNGINSETL